MYNSVAKFPSFVQSGAKALKQSSSSKALIFIYAPLEIHPRRIEEIGRDGVAFSAFDLFSNNGLDNNLNRGRDSPDSTRVVASLHQVHSI
jgi:hypothetical protein